MRRTRKQWVPIPGGYASYIGRSSRLLRGGKLLEVVAEAAGRRIVVKAIGHAGRPVQFTVLAKNLGQPQPQLFD